MLEASNRFVLERQLETAFGRLPAILLSFPLVALGTWLPLHHHIPSAHMLAWIVGVSGVGVAQWWIGRLFQRDKARNLERWARVRVACALANGLCWGGVLGTALFIPEDPFLGNFVLFIIGGTSVVALASTSAHRPSLVAFELANTLPVVCHLLLQGTSIHLAMAGLTLGFLLVVLLIGRHMSRNTEHLIRAEDSNGRLLRKLTEAQSALEESNATLQRNVRERTAQLEVALAEMQQQQLQLRQAERMEAVGRLAGGIAHDFNNVLTGIAGCAGEVLDSLDERDCRRQDLEDILHAIDRASRLTKQLLGFAKGGLTRPEVVELVTQLRQLDKMLRRVLPQNIELCWQLPEEPVQLFLDPGELDQLIMNLVVNARDAMANGGTIHVQATKDSGALDGRACAVIRVTDNGTGIHPEVIEHVFEPFVTTKGEKGTGFGLATCFGIVKRAGGSIQVTSDWGRGATFEVRLPLGAQVVSMPSPAPRTPSLRPSLNATVLVVEDQGVILKIVARALEGAGYTVHPAVSAEQALALVVTQGLSPDLVISDVVLPHMSGIDLRDALRSSGCKAKFLFMSGYIDEASLRRKDSGEAVALLTKPFTMKELLDAANEILRSEVPASVQAPASCLLN